jgi:hypothetical protein
MNGAALLLALATLGVDYGWRLDDRSGQLEYIIQIPPQQLETLRDAPEGISSAIPPEVVRHVKKFRIVVGNDVLPRDPLPEFAPERQGAVTPIGVGAARVSPVGGDFGGNDGANVNPNFESDVTPLNLNAPRNALPGPGQDRDPADAVLGIVPLPPIPRASGLNTDIGSLGLTNIRPTLRREGPSAANGNWQPNVNAPDTSDTWGGARSGYSDLAGGGVSISRSPPRTALNNGWNGPTTTNVDPQKNYLPLLFAVCALCLSIGGNVYLGWIAWGYYMRYRESFDSLRGNWSSGN